MSRVMVYIIFAVLAVCVVFAIAAPPQWRPQHGFDRCLQQFLAQLESSPQQIQNVRLINGQAEIYYTLTGKDREESTVIPIEWKGRLVQQLIEKHVRFTVADPDYTPIFLGAGVLAALAFFRFSVLPGLQYKTCANCAERILSAATICRYCGAECIPFVDNDVHEQDEEEVEEVDNAGDVDRVHHEVATEGLQHEPLHVLSMREGEPVS